MKRKRVSRKELEGLLMLPWTVELKRNHDGTYFARVVELPGCMTEGSDEAEAVAHLRKALALWLEAELEQGHDIPEPAPYDKYSGKFTVRTSPLVHRLAAETARRLGVSLNELASEALALVAGANRALAPRKAASNRSKVRRSRSTADADWRARSGRL